MKKKIVLVVILVMSLFIMVSCSSGSSSGSSSSNSSNNSAASDNTTASDNTSASDSTSASGSTNTATSVVGDWEYAGTIDGKNYEITLDLESDDQFELDVDEETTEDTIDSEAKGTYVADDSTITLSIITVQDNNSYFGGEVVQNGQVALNYTLSNNGNTMTIDNAKDSIAILPAELTLTKD